MQPRLKIFSGVVVFAPVGVDDGHSSLGSGKLARSLAEFPRDVVFAVDLLQLFGVILAPTPAGCADLF